MENIASILSEFSVDVYISVMDDKVRSSSWKSCV